MRLALERLPNYRIVNFDKLTYAGNLENLTSVEKHPRYRFVNGDIASPDDIALAFEGEVAGVFHLAAESHVDRSIHDASPFVKTNVLGTQCLLDAAREKKVAKFVHVSTDEVYGSPRAAGALHRGDAARRELAVQREQGRERFVGSGRVPHARHAIRDHPLFQQLRPLPIPGKVASARHLERDRRRADPGVRRRPERPRLALRGRPLRRAPAGPRIGAGGEVYNIGGNNEQKNLDLVKGVLRLLGKPESLIRFVKDRPGHDRRYAIDASKIDRELCLATRPRSSRTPFGRPWIGIGPTKHGGVA